MVLMKEKIHDWWIRNKNSDWLYAFLLTCLISVLFLVLVGIVIILHILNSMNIGLYAVGLFVLMFLGFLFLLKC